VDVDKSGVPAYFNSDSKPHDVTASVAISGDRLYAFFRTGEKDLLRNSGEVATAPFKTGGALDLMIGTNPKSDPKRERAAAGDVRLLVTRAKGKTFAVLYKAVFGDQPSATVANWIVTNATNGVITGNPGGTPNKLLFKSTL